jgi:serine/threonine protein kinase
VDLVRPDSNERPQPARPDIPGYEILVELGRGGMGVVYTARQTKLDRIVASKLLSSETGNDLAFAERFNREARALAKLNHPNIVTVYDFGQSRGQSYFIMEYVDGVNLRQRLRAGVIAPEQTLPIVTQICDALQYAHEEGIIHRDIKPANILLDKKGRVKIADFGLAKLLVRRSADFTLTGPMQVMGTLHYMAPEQIEKPRDVDHRADIYSLGVVFYEMLTGELPLGRFAPPSQKLNVDARWDEVVLRALEKEPQGRFQNVNEFRRAVESLAKTPDPPLCDEGETKMAVEPTGMDSAVLISYAPTLLEDQRKQREGAVIRAGGWLGAILGGIVGSIVGLIIGIKEREAGLICLCSAAFGAVAGAFIGRAVAGFYVGYAAAMRQWDNEKRFKRHVTETRMSGPSSGGTETS